MAKVIVIAVCVILSSCLCGISALHIEDESTSIVTQTVEISESTSAEETATELETESETTDESYHETTEEQIGEEPVDAEKEYLIYYTDADAIDIAKVLFNECGGVSSRTEQACVAWCVLNRADETGNSIYNVLRQPNQFAFYESTYVRDDLLKLAYDVLKRWNDEKNGITDSGRVLPKEYTYFHGDGVHNYFRNDFDGDYDIWDYSSESPYEN